MIIQGFRAKPEVSVSFFTESGEIVVRAQPSDQDTSINREILQVTTENDLLTDAGKFSIYLIARRRWDKILAANDLIVIRMKQNPMDDDKKSIVMYGLLDDVRPQTAIANDEIKRGVVITGRTFAKVLLNFEIGVVQDGGEIGNHLGWLRGKINFAAQSSASIVRQLYDQFVVKYADYTFHNGTKLTDLIKLDLSSREGEQLLGEMSFINYQGNMHNFFKEVIDEPFNQMFWEVKNGEPTLIVRETPFNPDKWNALPRHEITDEQVISKNIGRHDLETYTLYSVGVANHFGSFGDQNNLGLRPLVYEPYLKKYGIRRLHRFSNYIGAGSSNGEPPTEVARRYYQDLFNWNILNPRFYNGEIIVHGDHRFKLGDRLLFKSKEDGRNLEFFIESVQHEFNVYGSWITRLGVTRGLEDNGAARFQVPWGAYKEYQGGGVGDPTPAEIAQLQQAWLGQFGLGGIVAGTLPPDFGPGATGVAKYYLSSPFRKTAPYGQRRGNRIHRGVDLAAPTGTRLYALMDGVVSKVAYQAGGAGHYIVINHTGGYQTKYFHMRERSPLREGTRVTAGQHTIGYVGSTGRSTGPHLHLELWINGKSTDPYAFLQKLAKG